MKPIERVGLLGFGEVGQTLAADLAGQAGLALCAFDVQFALPSSDPSRALAAHPAVECAASAGELARASELVISAVTASEDLPATQSLLPELAAEAYLLDCNSVSPQTKRAARAIAEGAGARYVEAAIMSPIAPKRLASPILLGGPNAETLLPELRRLGFSNVSVCSRDIGAAAATKMCRSIIIKGMEAMLTEAMLSARYYGVESAVLDSLSNVLPAADWHELARYMMSRSIRHGERRAEEMREAAATVRDAGVEPWMSEAAAQRQAWAARFTDALSSDTFADMLDTVQRKQRDIARKIRA